jgi:hypothetical protein
MADISIQFHATPEENMHFVDEILRDFGTNTVAMRFFPFHLITISGEDVQGAFKAAPEYQRWAFTLGKPILSVAHELAFADENPDYLRLDTGRRLEKGLEQSWVSARTRDKEILAVWREIAVRLKKRTMQGVIAINPTTGETSRLRSFRFTKGARDLQSHGVAMLPFAGTALLRFEDNIEGPS